MSNSATAQKAQSEGEEGVTYYELALRWRVLNTLHGLRVAGHSWWEAFSTATSGFRNDVEKAALLERRACGYSSAACVS